MTNHSTFDNGSLGVPFHHIQHFQTTEDLEKNDIDATIFQQTNDVDVTQDDIAPQLQGHRKSHILSELDYFLKRCETVESSDMRPGPRNVNNHQYISMLADRVQHHHHHHNHYHTNESENHTHINTMQQSIHDGTSNHQSVQTLTKNYIGLATEYKMWDRYRIHRNFTNPCVVCLQFNALVKVFFPCEHRCICEPCFLKAKCWRECPLCKEGVRLTLDYSKNVQAKYWAWVDEIRPTLPKAFVSNFYSKSMTAVEEEMATTDELRHQEMKTKRSCNIL